MNFLQKLFGKKQPLKQVVESVKPVVVVDPDFEIIRSLISKLGSQWDSEWGSAKDQLIVYGEKAIPQLLYYINSNSGVLSASLTLDRDAKIDALRRAIYILGEVGNKKVVSELGIWTISSSPEWSKAAKVAITKIKAKEDSNIHPDLSMPYEQIAELWTTIIQASEKVYPPEKLYQYCTETMQMMPNLQFISTDQKAKAWSMLGSLFYMSLHPEWDGGASAKKTPCAESRRCYDEALQLTNEKSPNYKNWLEWKEQFSPELPNKSTNGIEVIFVREYQEAQTVNLETKTEKTTITYRVYRAENSEAAMQYLNNNPVEKELLYVIVETPDGKFRRDINGIYKE